MRQPASRSYRAVVERELQPDAHGSSGLALDGDVGRVAAEGIGVALDPVDARAKVEQAEVARPFGGLLLGRVVRQDAESVLQRDCGVSGASQRRSRTGDESAILADPVAGP